MVELTNSFTSHSLLIISQIGRIEYAPFARHIREKGVKIDVCDQAGRLPLHHAACLSLDFVEACASPDLVNIQDNAGDTP